jgi:hypothetical protein
MIQSARKFEICFLLVAGCIYTAALLSFARSGSGSDPLSLGFAVDLALTVPLLAYLLTVRHAGWPLLSLPALALLGLVTVLLFGPAGLPLPFRSPEALLIALECGLVGFIAVRAHHAWRRSSDAATDALERLRLAAREVVPVEPVADALAHELAVVYYALFSWRSPASVPEEAQAFSYHRRSGYGGVVVAVLMLSVVEGAAVHLLLARWSVLAAWALTLLTIYGVLWFVADYRASVLRPVLLTPTLLRVRTGLRWSVQVARFDVAGVERSEPPGTEAVLRAVLLGQPTHWIRLRAPVVANGPYGFKRTVEWVALAVDDAEGFTAALEPA